MLILIPLNQNYNIVNFDNGEVNINELKFKIDFYIQSDSKPLRQTLRADRVNNKEHSLLNNLCLLKRRLEVTIDFC